ncbi:hypothetical protein [Microbacterium sp. USHLN272]|uniref:hypothetical protein n=1 Tax=Microbacterium sp. USHLN272 TaxID=3081287 RepID=UPI0030167673
MTIWDWLWAWTRDNAVWDWLRPTLAALLGALVGGLFTLWGQRQSMSVQRDRDEDAWERAQESARYQASREDAKHLFEDFVSLAREIQEKPLTWAQIQGKEGWSKDWRAMWTTTRSLGFDVRTRLLPDIDVRSALLELLDFLDNATNLSREDGFPSPGLNVGVRRIVEIVTSEGIDVMGGFLRGDPYKPVRASALEGLREAKKKYADWEDHMIKNSEEAARAWDAEQAAERAEAAAADAQSAAEGASSDLDDSKPAAVAPSSEA